MEFGRIPYNTLDSIDFRLPADPDVTTDVLKNGNGKTQFYIGCSRLNLKEWVGKLHPAGTREKDFLKQYSRLFNTVEFSTTFYNTPTIEQVATWKSKAGKDFRFCPKFPQTITHLKQLKDVQPEVNSFLDAIGAFGEHLGPTFLMPHPSMGNKQQHQIEAFIASIPDDVALFLEVRHSDFYINGYSRSLYDFLRQQRRGTVITDTAGRRDCVHMHLSTPEAFIRFVGNGLHPTDYTRIDEWVARIGQWMQQGLEKLYFFMHQHDELHTPELIKYFIEQMNTRWGTSIPNIRMQQPSNTLF